MATIDGRVERGNRSREAIIEALLGLYEDGNLRPSIPEVAARAGVSVRSVHNHFADVESLRNDAGQRQMQRLAHLWMRETTTLEQLVLHRSELYEAITPVRRAALLQIHESPALVKLLANGDRMARQQLQELFPGVDGDTLTALELLTSWDSWNRLRTVQGCSVARARRVFELTIRKLIEGDAS